MAAISNQNNDVVAKLIPGGAHDFSHVSDEQLLANTRRIAGTSNQVLAALLAHLAEVEVRGIHRTRRCASLYTYCIYELRFSEDAAARRSAAARLTRQFPLLLQAIADGELHLTGLLMLGPHLTPDNHAEVLARAKFRTKKELTKLVRELHPLPHIPDRIEPAGPPSPRPPRNPTWEELVTAYAPRVRELPPGERPRDWTSDRSRFDSGDDANSASDVGDENDGGDDSRNGGDGNDVDEGKRTPPRLPFSAANHVVPDVEPLPLGPIPRDLPPVTAPQQYQVQFSTVEEHAQLIERARALLSRERAGMTLGELHLEAMRLLVASLEKRRFAIHDGPPRRNRAERGAASGDEPPRQRGAERSAIGGQPPRQRGAERGAAVNEPPRQRGAKRDAVDDRAPRQRGAERSTSGDKPSRQRGAEGATARFRQPSRYVPAAERREVYRRDGGRCTYVDARGERCGETHHLELHHLQPFAKNGQSSATNLTLRCRAHNAFAAEEDFGRELITKHRDSQRHEPQAVQAQSGTD